MGNARLWKLVVRLFPRYIQEHRKLHANFPTPDRIRESYQALWFARATRRRRKKFEVDLYEFESSRKEIKPCDYCHVMRLARTRGNGVPRRRSSGKSLHVGEEKHLAFEISIIALLLFVPCDFEDYQHLFAFLRNLHVKRTVRDV